MDTRNHREHRNSHIKLINDVYQIMLPSDVAVTLVCVNTLYDVHTMRLPNTTFLEMYSVFGCPVDRLDR